MNFLTKGGLRGLQTNNLEADLETGYLAGFGKRAAFAKFRNNKFTAKGTRNSCALLLTNSI